MFFLIVSTVLLCFLMEASNLYISLKCCLLARLCKNSLAKGQKNNDWLHVVKFLYFIKHLRVALLILIRILNHSILWVLDVNTQREDPGFLMHLQLYVVWHKQGCLLFIIVPDRGRGILKENIHNNILLTGDSAVQLLSITLGLLIDSQ